MTLADTHSVASWRRGGGGGGSGSPSAAACELINTHAVSVMGNLMYPAYLCQCNGVAGSAAGCFDKAGVAVMQRAHVPEAGVGGVAAWSATRPPSATNASHAAISRTCFQVWMMQCCTWTAHCGV